MKNQLLSQDYQHASPAGAEVRLLMHNTMASVAHCTLRKGVISKAVAHRTVNESDLVFICVTTPPWSGSDEAYYVDHGAWIAHSPY